MSWALSELHKGPCLQGLAIALQHPLVAANQQIICRLLQVSKVWRAVVQQSAAGLTDVKFERCILTDKLNTVSSFARWLAKHAGLPHTIDFQYIDDSDGISCCGPDMPVIQQLLEFAMQFAAAAATSAAPLRLQSYTSCVPPTAGLLAALPAATLTSLDLRVDGSNWCSHLSNLTSLRKLQLYMMKLQPETANVCLREISKLKQLTQLDLEDVPSGTDLQLLPVQLQQLGLEYMEALNMNEVYVCKPVVLQQLTGLQDLKLVVRELAAESSVPSTLQSLHLEAKWGSGVWSALSSLQHVTSVTLCRSLVTGAHLNVLKQLPQLKDLSLGLEYVSNPEPNVWEVCVAWHNLPLRDLDVSVHELSLSSLQLLIQNVSTVTQLTSLVIDVQDVVLDHVVDEQPLQLVVCESLRVLTNLRSLQLHIGEAGMFCKSDARHLSALVNLTHLDVGFYVSGPYLDAATVCLLAVTLTKLESLSINREATLQQNRISLPVLPAVGRLTALSSLRLGTLPPEVAEQGLDFLTGLSRLTELQGFEVLDNETIKKFWAIIEAQRSELS